MKNPFIIKERIEALESKVEAVIDESSLRDLSRSIVKEVISVASEDATTSLHKVVSDYADQIVVLHKGLHTKIDASVQIAKDDLRADLDHKIRQLEYDLRVQRAWLLVALSLTGMAFGFWLSNLLLG